MRTSYDLEMMRELKSSRRDVVLVVDPGAWLAVQLDDRSRESLFELRFFHGSSPRALMLPGGAVSGGMTSRASATPKNTRTG